MKLSIKQWSRAFLNGWVYTTLFSLTIFYFYLNVNLSPAIWNDFKLDRSTVTTKGVIYDIVDQWPALQVKYYYFTNEMEEIESVSYCLVCNPIIKDTVTIELLPNNPYFSRIHNMQTTNFNRYDFEYFLSWGSIGVIFILLVIWFRIKKLNLLVNSQVYVAEFVKEEKQPVEADDELFYFYNYTNAKGEVCEVDMRVNISIINASDYRPTTKVIVPNDPEKEAFFYITEFEYVQITIKELYPQFNTTDKNT